MAEAIGLITGVATLVGSTFKLTQLSYEYMHSVHQSANSVSTFLQELLALNSVLVKFQEVFHNPNVSAALSSDRALLFCQAVAECENEVVRLQERLDKYRGSKLSRLTWPLREKETKATLETLHRWRDTFESFGSICTLNISSATLVETRNAQSEVQRSTILDWISRDLPTLDNSSIAAQRCPGTCSWIINHEAFVRWLSRCGSFMVCLGGPGVGKTILSSFIISHLQTSLTDAIVMYYYFDFRAERKHHTPGVVARSLLRQYLQHQVELPDSILNIQERHGRRGNEVDDQVWVDELLSQLQASKQAYIVFDAWDECADRTNTAEFVRRLNTSRAQVLMTSRPISDTVLSSEANISIEVSAQSADLKTYLEARITDNEDLGSLLHSSLKDEITAKVIEHAAGVFLLGKIAVDSLSSSITIRQMRQALLQLPKDLPTAYENTFERILQSRPVSKRDLALKTLAWLHHVERPLTMQELLHALALEPGDDHVDQENITTSKMVVNSCLGLVEFREADGSVRLVHATVQEFLLTHCQERFVHSHKDVARSCLSYLSQEDFRNHTCTNGLDLEDRLRSYPLLGYAACHWGHHASRNETELILVIEKLIYLPNAVTNVSQVLHYLRRVSHSTPEATFSEMPQGFGEMHLLAFWNLHLTAARLPESLANVTNPDSLGWTPLHWAAARGHIDMMSFLLSRNVDIEAKDARGWSPLFWSTFWSHPDAVSFLLEQHANINLQDVEGRTPLHVAVARRDAHIIKILLLRGADRHKTSGSDTSPLDEALLCQKSEVTSLFENWSDHSIDMRAEPEMVKLEKATRDDDFPIFKHALSQEIEASKRKGWTNPLLPRFKYILSNRQVIGDDWATSLTFLLSSRSSTSAEEIMNNMDFMDSVLLFAILAQQIDLVRMMIQNEVSIAQHLKGIRYTEFAPLHVAVFAGSESLVSFLMSKGADPSIRDDKNQTPLHYAAILGHLGILRLLLKSKTLVNMTDYMDRSALHSLIAQAARNAWESASYTKPSEDVYLAIIHELVRGGADINSRDARGSTPLHEAISTTSLRMTRKLLQLGADPNARKFERHRLPVKRDMYQKFQKVLRRHSKESTYENVPCGDTPLTLACARQNFDLAKALLDSDATMPEEVNLQEPLIKSIEYADSDMVKRFLELGITAELDMTDQFDNCDVTEHLRFARPRREAGEAGEAQDASSPAPLILIAFQYLENSMTGDYEGVDEEQQQQSLLNENQTTAARYYDVIKVLIDAGYNLNVQDGRGDTALLIALRSGYNETIIPLLFEKGADIRMTNKQMMGVLHSAAASGNLNYVKWLIDKGADINLKSATGDSPILFAAINGHFDVVAFLTAQPDFDTSGRALSYWLTVAQLRVAIENRDLSESQRLIRPDLPLNAREKKGRTLLHRACDLGMVDVVQKLVQLGADPNVQDIYGDTALHPAARNEQARALVALLLTHGADIKIRNKSKGMSYGRKAMPWAATALHITVFKADFEATKALLDGADWNGLWRAGRGVEYRYIDLGSGGCGITPLMIAARDGNTLIAQLLLDRGADINIQAGSGSWGVAALDMARMSGCQEMIELIEKNGGEEFDW